LTDRPKEADKAQRGKGSCQQDLSITVSIGAAESGAPGRQPSAVMKAADEALYRAKDSGRNRLAIAE
jgi:diguanylate cyclase (GGDEF)-like protein